MEGKRRKLSLAAIILVCMNGGTGAQERQPETDPCFINQTEIISIREPQFGAVYDWDMSEGDDGMEQYADIVPLEEGAFVVGGSFTKDKKDDVVRPLLIHFDNRFKKVWEMKGDASTSKTIEHVLKTKAGYTVAGDLQDKTRAGFYIGFVDDKGKAGGEEAFYEPGGRVEVKSIHPADGGSYIVAAQFTDAKDDEKQYGLIYNLSASGKLVWKRAYRPGPTTVFQALQPTLDGAYVVAGQIVTGNKSAGWAMRVEKNGAIGWQRTYPRGLAASLYGAGQFTDGSFILTGKIRPLTGAKSGLAGWVMKTDATGAPLWQRYFQSEFYDYSASDVITYEDGRASILVNGAGLSSDQRSHARLATFNQRGQVLSLEDFTSGQNAQGAKLVSGLEAERIFTGYNQTSFGDDQAKDEPAPIYTYDGWVVAAPALDPYSDQCIPEKPKSPILR